MRRTLAALVVACTAAAIVATLAESAQAQSCPPNATCDSGRHTIDLVQVSGIIDPPTAGYLKVRIASAQNDGSEALILQLDTPGGLDTSMREIVSEIVDSQVPVIAWVAPRGARAVSAGTFIAYAANLLYMADTTEIGAASPVDLGGGELPPTEKRKVTEDAATFLRSLAEKRGRDVTFAEQAVTEARSISAPEAERLGVSDGTATSLRDVLQAIDGKSIEVADGTSVTIESWDVDSGQPTATIRFGAMNPWQRLLHAVTSPEIAFFLVLIGAFGLIFEIYNPGIGLAGILGAGALGLAFYSLNTLPTDWIGVLIVIAAVILFLIDMHRGGLGAWTLGGVVALVAGGLLMFSGAPPSLSLSPVAIGVAVVLTFVFFISVMTAALRVRLRRPITGEEGIGGEVGEAKTDIAPEGTVLTKGTLWRARTMETGIAAGSKVQVKAAEGLVLLVEPLHDSHD
ncbi:MAG: nodulation protein NfeD [Actinomycetota bacterium]|nr:nodulation protein NfeD [Actinomycetota bacterium]